MIRPAVRGDAERIAEILVFTKRVCYRDIFRDDYGSFRELSVCPLARELGGSGALDGVWCYEDGGVVKGMLRARGDELAELYVDVFFEGAGIGAELLRYAVARLGCRRLWVLEQNARAIRFYERGGFRLTGEREPEEAAGVYRVLMRYAT